MHKTLFIYFAGMCISVGAIAQGLAPLDDKDLAQISGGDGINFGTHLALNDPTLPGAINTGRFSIGFNVDGRTTYFVADNLSGTIDFFGLNLDVKKKPDGTDYVAIQLPEYVKFTNFGVEKMGVQTDPLAPITNSLGGVNLNGTLSMQGQFRFWAH